MGQDAFLIAATDSGAIIGDILAFDVDRMYNFDEVVDTIGTPDGNRLGGLQISNWVRASDMLNAIRIAPFKEAWRPDILEGMKIWRKRGEEFCRTVIRCHGPNTKMAIADEQCVHKITVDGKASWSLTVRPPRLFVPSETSKLPSV